MTYCSDPSLDHFESAFDHNKALSDGFIVPKPGFDDLYDDCVQTQKQAVSRLHQFLAEMKNKLNCNTISFIPPSKKNAYQLEIPESRVGRSGKGKKGIGKLPTDIDWEFKGHRKGWERYGNNTGFLNACQCGLAPLCACAGPHFRCTI